MDQKKRKPIIAANWKMHKVNKEAIAYVKAFRQALKKDAPKKADILILPSFTCIQDVADLLKGTGIHVGAQDVFYEKQGAYTGEISGDMLHTLGCEYVLVGHSERRKYFHETDEAVNKKLRAALEHKLTPILCVGETILQREGGMGHEVITRQLHRGLEHLSPAAVKQVVIAYEPVWAISTTANSRHASPVMAEEMHAFIRRTLSSLHGGEVAGRVRIIYGGSVDAKNAKDYLREQDVDGVLVGGASLDAKGFARIADF